MKQWIIFLIVPIASYMAIDTIASFSLIVLFDMDWDDGWFRVWAFIYNFFIGAIFFACAPNKNKALALTLAICLCGYDFYLGINTHGNIENFLGTDVIREYYLLTSVIGYAGMIFGVFSAAEAEKDKVKENAAA